MCLSGNDLILFDVFVRNQNDLIHAIHRLSAESRYTCKAARDTRVLPVLRNRWLSYHFWLLRLGQGLSDPLGGGGEGP
jgi:hypothetical protein